MISNSSLRIVIRSNFFWPNKLTNFDVPKRIGNFLLERNLIHGKEIILLLLNFVEDRRIDQLVYNTAPGYQSYYKAMYNRYFYNSTIDNGIRSNKFRNENWESYIFRIVNIFNKHTDLGALAKLKDKTITSPTGEVS